MNLVLKKEKYILGRIGLNFWEFGEQLNYFGDLGNTLRELRQNLTGIWGDKSIIFRELGGKDPPGGPHIYNLSCLLKATTNGDPFSRY